MRGPCISVKNVPSLLLGKGVLGFYRGPHRSPGNTNLGSNLTVLIKSPRAVTMFSWK